MKRDRIKLIILVLLIIFIGIMMIYSASSIWSSYKFGNPYHFLILQIIYVIIGLIILFITSKIKYQLYYKYANLILFICIFLLILVLIPGVGSIRNGSRSWFKIGSFGLQPSEFMKLGLGIFVCKYLVRNENSLDKIKSTIFPILGVVGIVFLLIMLEPDMGSAMVLILAIVILLFASGIKLSFFAYCILLGLIGIAVLILIAPYRINRIISFLNPWSDPLGSGYQIIQSLYAIGPAGLLGLGYGNSIQKQFYLPEPQTDFIFAVIAEEFGIVGCLVVLTIFCLIFFYIIRIAFKISNSFGKYLTFYLGIIIVLQATLNMCVVVGLLPVTGVTLPFISYGGSSLLTSMISIGIILNISKNNI